MLIFIFDFISFHFKLRYLVVFILLMGLLGVCISERLDRDIIRVNQILISQYNPLFFKPFVRKLKKEVIIEVEEQTTQVESSTQKLEYPIGGQQNKIDEDYRLEYQV